MKKKIAAEKDKIQNESWIYSEDKVIEDLYKVLNDIWKGKAELPEEWGSGV